jgi:hypothetical protein
MTTFAGNPPEDILCPLPGSDSRYYLPLFRPDRNHTLVDRTLFTVNRRRPNGNKITYADANEVFERQTSLLSEPFEGPIHLTPRSLDLLRSKVAFKKEELQ